MARPLVVVTWNDASGSATATYEEHEIPHHAIEVRTVGWLMRDDEEGVSICCEDCGDGEWRGHTFIPRPMVISVVPVIKPRKKKLAKVKFHSAVTAGELLPGIPPAE